MDTIGKKEDNPPNSFTEAEPIVSVRDREFCLGCPRPRPLHIAYFLPHSPDEAFAAKHMPDMGHDIKEFQVFHWELQGWKNLEKKLTSPEFDCGGHKWYVLPSYRSVFLLG